MLAYRRGGAGIFYACVEGIGIGGLNGGAQGRVKLSGAELGEDDLCNSKLSGDALDEGGLVEA